MAYKANVGGIFGSGEQMPSAPQIDVAGAINAASSAFRNNREDAIRRAIMIAQANREQQASRLQEATAAANGVLPTSAAQAYVKAHNDAYDAANPAPSPMSQPTSGDMGAPAALAPGAPPPVDASLAGAPDQPPAILAPSAAGAPAPPSTRLITPATPAGAPDATGRPQFAAPITSHGGRRLSSPIDLGNGYSVIPELTPAARQYDLLGARLDNNLDGRAITGEYGQRRVETQQGGANDRATLAAQSREDIARLRGQSALAVQAARAAASREIANMKGAGDPTHMTATQRINNMQKLAGVFVAHANGDPEEALAAAGTDPTIKSMGLTPEQLAPFIAAEAVNRHSKAAAADFKAGGSLVGSGMVKPENVGGAIKTLHEQTGGGASPETPLHEAPATMSDADAWEFYRHQGMSSANATTAVNGRHKK